MYNKKRSAKQHSVFYCAEPNFSTRIECTVQKTSAVVSRSGREACTFTHRGAVLHFTAQKSPMLLHQDLLQAYPLAVLPLPELQEHLLQVPKEPQEPVLQERHRHCS